ncbi:MAG: hypothetical protein WBK51_14490 [Polaromonas sp.]
MQPTDSLRNGIAKLADTHHCLFASQDLRALLPQATDAAFKTLLSRLVAQGLLTRMCRGLYVYERAMPDGSLLLFHAAARLRADAFNYISLETALSAAGLISQQPMQWVSIMSSGRSSVVRCSRWGTVEFVHTDQKPADIAAQLHYDNACHLWRASAAQAMRDMRVTRRSLDLMDVSDLHEPV